MSILAQVPVRLEVDLNSSPPVAPIDANTGRTPKIYRGGCVALLMALFDASGNPVDLSNLTQMQLVLQPSQLSPYAVVQKTVLAADFESTLITVQGWKNGTQWNVEFDLTSADTDQGLGGNESQDYWATIIGTTTDGSQLIYAAGPLTIFNPGSSLPNPAPGLTSRDAQVSNTGDITVTPASQLHKEVITVSGAARTQNCILGTLGMDDGAELTIIWKLPGTAGISFNLRSGVITNPVLANVATGDVLQERTKFFYDAQAATWVAEVFNAPAP